MSEHFISPETVARFKRMADEADQELMRDYQERQRLAEVTAAIEAARLTHSPTMGSRTTRRGVIERYARCTCGEGLRWLTRNEDFVAHETAEIAKAAIAVVDASRDRTY